MDSIKLFYREIKRISKDHSLILSVLLAPFFYLFFYGSIYENKVEENVNLAVIDNNNSELSRELIQFIDASDKVETVPYLNREEAIRSIENGAVIGMLIIPSDFDASLKSMKGTDLELYLNNSRFLPSNDVNEVISKVALTMGAGVRLKWEQQNGTNSVAALWAAQPINLKDHSMFVNPISYGGFLLPGILLLILQQTLLIGLAESVAREIELKTYNDWLRFGVKNAIIGKGLFYFILYMAYALFVHTVNYKVLALPNLSSAGDLTILYILFITLVIIFGIVIGTFFKKELYALQTVAFTSYPFFLLSGYAWPLESLPLWLKGVSNLFPITPMQDAYLMLVVKGATLPMVAPQLLHMLLLIVGYGSILVVRLRYLQHQINTTNR